MADWRPILDGDLADRALDAVRDIAVALPPGFSGDPSLGSGAAGIAMFHVASGDRAGAEELLDAAVDDVVARATPDAGLYGATVGLGWALSAIGRRLGEDDADESDVDELVLRLVTSGPWPGHFDLVLGLVGMGAYCLERLPRPTARAALDGVVAQLAATARHEKDGLAWLTTPAFYGPRADRYPDGHYDVGFAHGNAGVVAFLAAATETGATGAEALLRDGVSWLAACREPGADGQFPATIAPDGERMPARLAWCYGDPGVALALLAAGRALADPALTGLAREVAAACAGRVETSGVVDAGLCHGSAGAAHLFNRIGQATSDERVLDLARFWFTSLLDGRGPEGAVAGFPGPRYPGTDRQIPAYGFLEGVTGTGLALLSAATPLDPWWDFPMLLGAAGP